MLHTQRQTLHAKLFTLNHPLPSIILCAPKKLPSSYYPSYITEMHRPIYSLQRAMHHFKTSLKLEKSQPAQRTRKISLGHIRHSIFKISCCCIIFFKYLLNFASSSSTINRIQFFFLSKAFNCDVDFPNSKIDINNVIKKGLLNQ